MNKNQMDRAFLIRYFSGGVTPLERSRMEKWLSDEDNLEYFYEVLEEWERGNAQFLPDQSMALKRLNQQVNQESSKLEISRPNKTKGRGFTRKWGLWLAVASVFMLLVLGFLTRDYIQYKTYKTGFGMTRNIHLADGSEVVLNANSSLRVSRWMNWTASREAWVTGEAYFSVQKKNDHTKFNVYTSQLTVEVLGTKFNISDRNETARVVLQEGKVKVASRKKEKEVAVLEEEGDFAEVNETSEVMVTRNVDTALYMTWKEKQLKFVDAPLPEVLSEIGAYYGNRIVCSDSGILRKQFTGTLPNDDMAIILKALSNIYRAEFTPASGQNKIK